ncbi:MAG: rhomboid family intramembrane serine protease [Ignavibacteria bacterium]|nr:rhomboid family intramembrane serine protease [Ignavibacteria bacterium]
MQCPACNKSMAAKDYSGSKLSFCESCRGFWISAQQFPGFVKYLSDNEAIIKKFENAPIPDYRVISNGYCPDCNHLAESHNLMDSGTAVLRCVKCNGIWLKTEDIGGFLNWYIFAGKPYINLSSHEVKESSLESGGSFIKSFFGWIEDDIPVNHTPVVTYGLIIFNVVMFIMELLMAPEDAMSFTFVPARFFAHPLEFSYTLFSSMFLHGGVGHLFGNMFFLYIFGDNIEDRCGGLKYLTIYLFTGLLGGLIYGFFNFKSGIPLLGASGAISGILGCYLVLYPKAKLRFYKMIFVFPLKITVPVWVYIGIWFVAQQLIGITLNIQGVAWLVHLASMMSGVIIMYLLRKMDML